MLKIWNVSLIVGAFLLTIFGTFLTRSGVLASVPTTIMLVWVLRQREKQETTQWGQRAMSHFPPVIVVNGQGTNGYNGTFPTTPTLAAGSTANGPRQFKVVGQENTETIGDVLPAFWDEL